MMQDYLRQGTNDADFVELSDELENVANSVRELSCSNLRVIFMGRV